MAIEEIIIWFGKNILQNPAILLGIVAFFGLILQKKPIEEVVSGTVKVMVGVILMIAGATLFVNELSNFQSIVTAATGASPQYPPNYVPMTTLIADYGSYAVTVMTFGFILHLIIVWLVPYFRHIYLTGHLMWWVSLLVVATILTVNPHATMWEVVLIGSIAMAIYWTIQPKYMHNAMKLLTGSEEIGYGHTSSSVAWIAYKLGKYLGSPEESTEKLKIPKSLSFFKDYAISTAIILSIIMVIATIIGLHNAPETVAKLTGGLDPIVWAIIRGLFFAAAIVVLLTGVRIFIGEIVPAFRGISQKVIPGAIPALDCPIVFPYAPTAVIIGFISGLVTFLIMMGIFLWTKFSVIIPPMIMLFFPGGAAAVFGNRTGGWKGAVFAGALNGFVLAIGQAIGLRVLTYGPELATLGDPDWYIIVAILMLFLKPFYGS